MNQFNFEKDVKEIIEAAASCIGLNLSKGKDLRETLLDFLTVHNKLIRIKQRQVLVCPNLQHSLDSPPLNPKKKEIDAIIKIAQQGGNLNRFLSMRSITAHPDDYMRSEWFIYHFHLSLEKDKKKPNFVKRSDLLLFAYIDDDYIVFLDTDKHNNGVVFADTKWLELIHANFPAILEKYKSTSTNLYIPVFNTTTLSPEHIPISRIEPNTRKVLREKGYSLGGVKFDNTVYWNPGFGIMTSGHSMSDVIQTDSICNWIEYITCELTQHYDALCKKINVGCDDAIFEVIIPENLPGRMCLCEITTRQYILEYPCRINVKFICES